MSGEDDRGQAKPKSKALFDEADMIPHRARRAKPPPGIISAGGVDMARAHASGIKLRDAATPEPIVDQPRVVLAVETDPRKVPTHKRLLEGRERVEDGARPAMLPGGTLHATAVPTPASGSPIATGGPLPKPRPQAEPTVDPAPRPREQKLPLSMRVAITLILLLLLVGVVQRYRQPVAGEGLAAKAPAEALAVARPVHEAARDVRVEAPRAAPQPVTMGGAPPNPPASGEAPVALAPASPGAAPVASAEAVRRPVRAPPPRAAFTPPFQLPGEKN